jgi:hypothetical protein
MQSRPEWSRPVAGVTFTMLIALACGLLACSTASAQSAQSAEAEYDPFARNRVQLSVFAGVSNSGTTTYGQLGVGVGYFLLDGLELGLGSDIWFGDPTIVNLTPGLTYVFHMVPTIKPYLGSFYRHAFIFEATDLDSVGARAGLYFVGGHTYVGAGVVYERWLGCENETFVDCDEIYPEVVLAFAF